MVSIRVDFVTAPLLSTSPPRATKASTKVIEKVTIFVVLRKIGPIVLLSLFFYLSCIIQDNIHVQYSDFLVGDFLVDLILSVVFEVVNGGFIKDKSTS